MAGSCVSCLSLWNGPSPVVGLPASISSSIFPHTLSFLYVTLRLHNLSISLPSSNTHTHHCISPHVSQHARAVYRSLYVRTRTRAHTNTHAHTDFLTLPIFFFLFAQSCSSRARAAGFPTLSSWWSTTASRRRTIFPPVSDPTPRQHETAGGLEA